MQNKKFSPRQYIKERGRKLPIEKCLVSDLYDQRGLTMCLIIRKQPSGKYTFANILIDRLCLGVKSTIVNCNITIDELKKLIINMERNAPSVEVSLAYFHNLIYGAIDYASGLGFEPPKEFKLAEYILEPDLIDDGIDIIEFGINGKPFYISGPYDDSKRILSILNKNLGADGFDFIEQIS